MALFCLMDSQKTLVFLHGWGVSSEVFKPLYPFLGENFQIYALDLPGFGQTPIEKLMTLKDYAEFVHKFLKENNIKEPIIIGHSFGGAVAIKLALLYPNNISKLILVSASAIRHPRYKIMLINKIAGFTKLFLPEQLRKILIKLLRLDKTDYAQINNPKLKETFKNIINEDQSPYLSNIKIPTLVIWGEKDTVTPLQEGELIAKSIPNAKLSIIKNAGHFRFLENPEEFTKLIKDFIL